MPSLDVGLLSTFSIEPSFSAAFASSLEAPNINVTPNKIEAVPTVNLRIEYLLFILGKKSSFLDFFIELKPPNYLSQFNKGYLIKLKIMKIKFLFLTYY